MSARVINSGVGLDCDERDHVNGQRLGLTNVKNRLRLHYGENSRFSIAEVDGRQVEVSMLFPLQLSATSADGITRFGD